LENLITKRNKWGLLLLLMLIGTVGAYAQNYSARIYGKVVDTTGIPVENASIVVVGYAAGTSTTEAGRYELLVPQDVEITIEVRHLNCVSQRKKITVPADKRMQLNFEMIPTELVLNPTSIPGQPYSDGPERFNSKIIPRIPSFKSGVEDLVVLKGFASRNNELTSQYNVRGGNYDENLIYLNGVEIYRPFLIRSGQQEGLSFINPDLVSGISFSSGGFDAVYGNKMSSVLDVQYRTPTEFGASFSASLLGASGHLEGITKNGKLSALLGARYQSNGYIFRQMQTKGVYRPTFTDVQLLLNHKPKPDGKWEFSLFGNYARNVYLFIPDSMSSMFGPFDEVKKLTGYFDGQEVDAYQTVFASFTTKFSATKTTDLRLIFAYFNTSEKETFDIEGQYFLSDVNTVFGDSAYGESISSRDVGGDMHHGRNFLNAHIFHGELRGEHRLKNSRLEWGIKGQGEIVDDRLSEWRLLDSAGYSLPAISTVPNDSIGVPFEHPSRLITMGGSFLKVNNNLHTLRTEGFIQNRWYFKGGDTSQVILVTGVRFSYWSFNQEWLVTPRARLLFLPKKKKNLSLYLATGTYYQPAFYKEMRKEDGSLNTDIKAQKSYHIIAGTNYLFDALRHPFKLTTEVYYKHLWDLTTYNIDNVRIIYSGKNDANGYAVGVDARLSGELVDNLESWITFSLMQTKERVASDTFTFRPTDQRFSIHVFFQDKILSLPMFKAHISLFYATPLPYCLPNSRTYTSRGSSYYFRSDIGFSWQFADAATSVGKKGKKRLKALDAGYLTFEVSNLFNRSNLLSYSWVAGMDDYERNVYFRIPNYLTPRLFNVKLRLEFSARKQSQN